MNEIIALFIFGIWEYLMCFFVTCIIRVQHKN